MSNFRDSRTIEQISYLLDGKRKFVKATKNGTFILNAVEEGPSGRRVVRRELTAKEFVMHPRVINSDPVLTMKDGEKVRVFVGGSSVYLPAIVDGMLERNDRFEIRRRKFIKQKEQRQKEREKQKIDTDEYDNPFLGYWGDDYDD